MIRKAKIEDYLPICELATDLHNIHHDLQPDIHKWVDCALPVEQFKQLIEEEKMIVLEKEKHILGYVEIEIKQKGNYLEQEETILFINCFAVHEDYRGQGLGREFIEELEQYAKKKGYTKIKLNASFENKGAQAFYEAMGMKVRTIGYEKKIEKEV